MGFLSDTFNSVSEGLGFSTQSQQDAIKDASKATQAGMQKGVDYIQNNQDQYRGQIQPYADQGGQFLQPQAQGATLQGFGQNMNDMYNSNALQPMIDERMRDANSYMSSQGLSRSGGAAQAAADIPAEMMMQLEQMLYGRGSNMLDTGYNANQNLAQFGQQDATNIANLYSGQGAAESSGILGKQQARQAGFENIANTGMTLAAMGMGGGFGGMGGGGGASPYSSSYPGMTPFQNDY
jgi:hypothetical protein